jgi:hypothetical protein
MANGFALLVLLGFAVVMVSFRYWLNGVWMDFASRAARTFRTEFVNADDHVSEPK